MKVQTQVPRFSLAVTLLVLTSGISSFGPERQTRHRASPEQA